MRNPSTARRRRIFRIDPAVFSNDQIGAPAHDYQPGFVPQGLPELLRHEALQVVGIVGMQRVAQAEARMLGEVDIPREDELAEFVHQTFGANPDSPRSAPSDRKITCPTLVVRDCSFP